MLFDNMMLAFDHRLFYAPPDKGHEDAGLNQEIDDPSNQEEELDLFYGETVDESKVSRYLVTTRHPVINIDGIKASTISFAHDWFRLVVADDKKIVAYESNKGWTKIARDQSMAGSSAVQYVTFVYDGVTLTCDTTFESLKENANKPMVGILMNLDKSSYDVSYSTHAFVGLARCEFTFMSGAWKFGERAETPSAYEIHPTMITLTSDEIIIDFANCESLELANYERVTESLPAV